jgi:hypothetical protein
MHAGEKIQTALEDAKSGLRERLVRSIGAYTSALFAISGQGHDERLSFVGTGTFVKFGGSHYLLTAGHVWERLSKARGIGITLKENLDHSYPIEVNGLIPFGPAKPQAWNEWGPDLVFLKIPPNHVGGIEAVKSFYALDRARKKITQDGLEVFILMGTPGEFGKFTDQHAEVDINGLFAAFAEPYEHGDYDFLDLVEDVTLPGVPKHFGGVSGGGVWRVQLFEKSDGEVDWVWFLEAVAFYEIPRKDNRMTIRCHGQRSIMSAMEKIVGGKA